MSLPEKYNSSEMERILQRALAKRKQDGNVSHEQLIEVGRELGLSEQELSIAIAEEMRYGALDEAKEEVIEKRRSQWRRHLGWYVGVCSMLAGLNLMQEDGRLTWALATMFGWGVGVTIDTISTFFPNEKKLNKAARKLLRKREKNEGFDN